MFSYSGIFHAVLCRGKIYSILKNVGKAVGITIAELLTDLRDGIIRVFQHMHGSLHKLFFEMLFQRNTGISGEAVRQVLFIVSKAMGDNGYLESIGGCKLDVGDNFFAQ